MNYKILAKYIKNIKFEIPNSKVFFLLAKNISNYKINIDIKSNQIKEKVIEVETTLKFLLPIKIYIHNSIFHIFCWTERTPYKLFLISY